MFEIHIFENEVTVNKLHEICSHAVFEVNKIVSEYKLFLLFSHNSKSYSMKRAK